MPIICGASGAFGSVDWFGVPNRTLKPGSVARNWS